MPWGVARVSFASADLMEKMLGTKVGAATVFSALLDKDNEVRIVFDKDVLSEEQYGCSDGTTTGYMKIKTSQIYHDFLQFAKHFPTAIQVQLQRKKVNRLSLYQNRIVVKVRTSTLTNDVGQSDLRSFDRLACVLSDIQNMGP